MLKFYTKLNASRHICYVNKTLYDCNRLHHTDVRQNNEICFFNSVKGRKCYDRSPGPRYQLIAFQRILSGSFHLLSRGCLIRVLVYPGVTTFFLCSCFLYLQIGFIVYWFALTY